MFNTLKQHKYITMVILVVGSFGGFALYGFLNPVPEIEVIFQKGIYEYGSQINVQEMVLEVTPIDAIIEYPKLNMKVVGKYETSFKINNEVFPHTFVVTDTQMPLISLEMDNDLEVLEGVEYKVLSNIVSVKDPIDGDIKDYVQLNEIDYQKKLEKADLERTQVNNRVVGSNVEKVDETTANHVFYKTNLNVKKTGVYTMTVAAIDSNYNAMEQTWSIAVKPKGSIVNTGGVVECNSSKSLVETYAQIDTMEKINYGLKEKALSVEYNQTYVLTSNPLYYNVYDLYRDTLYTYESLSLKDGVELNIQIINDTKVKVTVLVYLDTYKPEENTLPFVQQLNDKSTLKSILKDAKDNQFVCNASY